MGIGKDIQSGMIKGTSFGLFCALSSQNGLFGCIMAGMAAGAIYGSTGGIIKDIFGMRVQTQENQPTQQDEQDEIEETSDPFLEIIDEYEEKNQQAEERLSHEISKDTEEYSSHTFPQLPKTPVQHQVQKLRSSTNRLIDQVGIGPYKRPMHPKEKTQEEKVNQAVDKYIEENPTLNPLSDRLAAEDAKKILMNKYFEKQLQDQPIKRPSSTGDIRRSELMIPSTLMPNRNDNRTEQVAKMLGRGALESLIGGDAIIRGMFGFRVDSRSAAMAQQLHQLKRNKMDNDVTIASSVKHQVHTFDEQATHLNGFVDGGIHALKQIAFYASHPYLIDGQTGASVVLDPMNLAPLGVMAKIPLKGLTGVGAKTVSSMTMGSFMAGKANKGFTGEEDAGAYGMGAGFGLALAPIGVMAPHMKPKFSGDKYLPLASQTMKDSGLLKGKINTTVTHPKPKPTKSNKHNHLNEDPIVKKEDLFSIGFEKTKFSKTDQIEKFKTKSGLTFYRLEDEELYPDTHSATRLLRKAGFPVAPTIKVDGHYYSQAFLNPDHIRSNSPVPVEIRAITHSTLLDTVLGISDIGKHKSPESKNTIIESDNNISSSTTDFASHDNGKASFLYASLDLSTLRILRQDKETQAYAIEQSQKLFSTIKNNKIWSSLEKEYLLDPKTNTHHFLDEEILAGIWMRRFKIKTSPESSNYHKTLFDIKRANLYYRTMRSINYLKSNSTNMRDTLKNTMYTRQTYLEVQGIYNQLIKTKQPTQINKLHTFLNNLQTHLINPQPNNHILSSPIIKKEDLIPIGRVKANKSASKYSYRHKTSWGLEFHEMDDSNQDKSKNRSNPYARVVNHITRLAGFPVAPIVKVGKKEFSLITDDPNQIRSYDEHIPLAKRIQSYDGIFTGLFKISDTGKAPSTIKVGKLQENTDPSIKVSNIKYGKDDKGNENFYKFDEGLARLHLYTWNPKVIQRLNQDPITKDFSINKLKKIQSVVMNDDTWMHAQNQHLESIDHDKTHGSRIFLAKVIDPSIDFRSPEYESKLLQAGRANLQYRITKMIGMLEHPEQYDLSQVKYSKNDLDNIKKIYNQYSKQSLYSSDVPSKNKAIP